jgi:hypothetical protein
VSAGPFQQGRIRRSATDQHRIEARQCTADVRLVESPAELSRHQREVPTTTEPVSDGGQIEQVASDRYRRGAPDDCPRQHHQTGHIVCRQRHDPVTGTAETLMGRFDRGPDRRPGENDTLGGAGRPGGGDDHRGVDLVHRHRGHEHPEGAAALDRIVR